MRQGRAHRASTTPRQQGFALLTGLLIAAISSLYLSVMMTQAMSTLQLTKWNSMLTQNDFIAEAGLDWAFYPPQLQTDVSTLYFNLHDEDPTNDFVTHTDQTLQFSTTLTYVTKTPAGEDIWSLVSKSPILGASANRRIIRTDIATRNISDFALLTGREGIDKGHPIVWASGDQVTGNMHTNDRWYLNGNPSFTGGEWSSVNSSDTDHYTCTHDPCNPTLGNPLYGQPLKLIPDVGVVEAWVRNRSNNVVLTGPTTVTFSWDSLFGKTKVHVVNSGLKGGFSDEWLDDTSGVPNNPYGLMITTQYGNVTVQGADGVLNGRVTISAIHGDIVIPGSSGLNLPKCDPLNSGDLDCHGGADNNDRLNLFAIGGNIRVTSTAATVKLVGIAMLAWDDLSTKKNIEGQILVSPKTPMLPGLPTLRVYGINLAEYGFDDGQRMTFMTQDPFFNTEGFGEPLITSQRIAYYHANETGP